MVVGSGLQQQQKVEKVGSEEVRSFSTSVLGVGARGELQEPSSGC